MKKLAIISTHPIQYNAPVFSLLSERNKIRIKVFYTWENSKTGIFDKKFGKEIKWDIPLLEAYDYQFVKNISKEQGTHHFYGMTNPDLNQTIMEWGADAVLIYGWNYHSHYKAMKYFKGRIPVYFRGDSTLIDEKPGLKTILRRFWLKHVYRSIDFAFYTGENNKNYFLKHGIKKTQLIFAPHAIDNERFNDKEGKYTREALIWLNNLGISGKELVFLYAGKFEPKKDPELFIRAARLLKNQSYKFILAGDGELKEKLMTLAGDNDSIIFIPFQNQSLMPVLYRLCHVFVMPSKGPGETWGLAVNEAMACNKAVLVSDKTGCAPELVKDGINGFTFKSGNLADFMDKILRFTNQNCIKFGNNSMDLIKDFCFVNLAVSIETAVKQN